MTNTLNHEKEAEKILLFLVNRIKNFDGGYEYITYGDLAKAVGYPPPYVGSFFAGRIGKTLGVMGHLFEGLKVPDWKGRIPYIQSLVVNQSKKLPSNGLSEFETNYPILSDEKKRDYVKRETRRIFDFGERWFIVLDELGIDSSYESEKTEDVGKTKKFNPFGNEGSPEHRKLRDYIANNPMKIGLPNKIKGQVEIPLKSGDSVDVVFQNDNLKIGVEVKSIRSGENDHERGIFQCIKYREVMKAESLVLKEDCEIDCFLVHENDLSRKLIRMAKKLAVVTIQVKLNV